MDWGGLTTKVTMKMRKSAGWFIRKSLFIIKGPVAPLMGEAVPMVTEFAGVKPALPGLIAYR